MQDHDIAPINPLPPVVWLLVLPMIGVELVLSLAEAGMIGGRAAIGWRVAALEGFGSVERKNLILIAGGQGKDQDFSGLQSTAAKYLKQALLLGQDAAQIDRAIKHVCDTQLVDSMQSAVELAARVATAGDIVLLSPACASFDLFENYEDRGKQFKQAVYNL